MLISCAVTGQMFWLFFFFVYAIKVFSWCCSFQDLFIGYGGNVTREAVKEKASWFVTDFKELIQALEEPAAGS